MAGALMQKLLRSAEKTEAELNGIVSAGGFAGLQ